VNASKRAWKALAIALPAAAALSCGGGGGGGGSCRVGSATGTAGGYQIELQYLTALTGPQEAAFEAAAARLQAIVTTVPSQVKVTWNATARSYCEVPADQSPPEIIKGLVIFVTVEDLGTGGILAESGPCLLRGSSRLPAAAVMKFNSSYLDSLSDLELGKTVQHEMLHTLGFGTLWAATSITSGFGCGLLSGYGFTGGQALAAAKADNDAPPSWTTVPVEDCVDVPGSCGSGTRKSHWRYSAFFDPGTNQSELMTGWITPYDQPLSATTLASLEDLGYDVDPTQADAYAIPSTSAALAREAAPAGGLWLGDDVRRVPPLELDEF